MNIYHFKSPLIIAHRGYKAKCPENTLRSVQAAFEADFQMVEVDVTLTKDRKMVVIHDDTLERTTNGSGHVQCHFLKDLKQLDAGSWFDPAFKDEKIPTLEEVLSLVSGRGMVNIEIKKSAYEPQKPDDRIEQQIVEVIQQKRMQQQVLVSSFKVKILENLSRMSNKPAIALISKGRANQKTMELCKRLGVFSWHPKFSVLDKNQVIMMQRAGIYVFPYTVNSIKTFKRMMSIGVDGLFSDHPHMNR